MATWFRVLKNQPVVRVYSLIVLIKRIIDKGQEKGGNWVKDKKGN